MSGRAMLAVNSSYFSNLNESSAYWLGFIQADGNIYQCTRNKSLTLSVEIHASDGYLLERLKRDIEAEHEVSLNNRGHARLRITSKQMCEDLMKHGVLPRKSFTGTFPKIENPCLFRHYVRGVFDGDGSITIKNRKGRNPRPRAVILGSRGFCEWTLPRIQEFSGIGFGGIGNYTSIFGITFDGYQQTEKLYKWLYKDSGDLFFDP